MKRFEKTVAEMGSMYNGVIAGKVSLQDFCATVQPFVLYNASRIAGNQNGEDVAQDVMIKLMTEIQEGNVIKQGSEGNFMQKVLRYAQSAAKAQKFDCEPISTAYSVADTVDMDAEIDRKTCDELLASAVSTLTEREQKVLSLLYGLDADPLNYGQTAKVMNVTRERIRQIEGKALRKLRHPSRMKNLKAFVD